MADTWEMSFLVDQTTQIQEARGNLARHFGMLQQVLVGKHLVNFVGNDDRLPFLRMMGRLSQRNWTDTVAFRFRTPLSGERRLALQARPGSGPTAWWLMLAENGADGLPLIGEVEHGETLTSENEFSLLAQSAATDPAARLDVSVFRAAILADNQPNRVLSQEKHAELDQKIGEALQDHATSGAVSRPEPGHYALLHQREVSPYHIVDKITATASTVGVTKEKLGLSHHSTPLAADTGADAVRDLVRSMRQNLGERSGSFAAASRKAPSLLDTLKQLVGVGTR